MLIRSSTFCCTALFALLLSQASLLADDFYFQNTTISEDITFGSGDNVYLQGDIILDDITLDFGTGASLFTPHEFGAPASIEGNGIIQLGGSIWADSGVSTDPSSQVTIGENIQLLGYGGIRNSNTVNRGTITSGSGIDPSRSFFVGGYLFSNEGVIEANANRGLRIYTKDFRNTGDILALNQGAIFIDITRSGFGNQSGGRFVNDGLISVGNKSELHIDGLLENHGTININDSTLLLENFEVTGSGSMSVQDSLMLAGAGTTIAQLQAVQASGQTYGIAGSYKDLEGGTLDTGNIDGHRWIVSGGFRNGTINSLDGTVLEVKGEVLFNGPLPILRDIELNAQINVGSNQNLTIESELSGSGKVLLNGGRITLSSASTAALDLLEQNSGELDLSGNVDNTGRSLRFQNGIRNRVYGFDGFVFGGVVSAEDGAKLDSFPDLGSPSGTSRFRDLTMQGSFDLGHESGMEMYLQDVELDDATFTYRDGVSDYATNGFGARNLTGHGELNFQNDEARDFTNYIYGEMSTWSPDIAVNVSSAKLDFFPSGNDITTLQGTLSATNQSILDSQLIAFKQNGHLSIDAGSHWLSRTIEFTEQSKTSIEFAGREKTAITIVPNSFYSNQAYLAGTLNLVHTDISMQLGETVTLLESPMLNDVFQRVQGVNLSPDYALAVTYDETSVYVTAARSGDLNLDGIVDIDHDVTTSIQLLPYSGFYDLSWKWGDIDGDGLVTASDDVLETISNVTEISNDIGSLESLFDTESGILRISGNNVDGIAVGSSLGGLLGINSSLEVTFSNDEVLAWFVDDISQAEGGFLFEIDLGTEFNIETLSIDYSTLGSGVVLSSTISSVPEPQLAFIVCLGYCLTLTKRRRH